MCVLFWENSPEGIPCTQQGQSVRIWLASESIAYSLSKHKVEIALTVVAKNQGQHPVNLHVVHRRHVHAADRSTSFLIPNTNAQEVTNFLMHVHSYNDASNGVVLSPCSDPSLEIQTKVRSAAPALFDLPELDLVEDIPFTSLNLGTISPEPVWLAFRIGLCIADPVFSDLVVQLRRFPRVFQFGIDGPEVVKSSIESLDLHEPNSNISEYSDFYYRFIRNCIVIPEEYEVATIDFEQAQTAYSRVYSQVSQIMEDVEITTLDQSRALVNVWSCDRSDFMIQRLSRL